MASFVVHYDRCDICNCFVAILFDLRIVKKNMKQEEHKLQCVLVKYLDYMGYDFFAIPNGGLRNIKVASKLKAEGVKSGVADLFICLATTTYHGLFIEVKYGKNKQSDTQVEFERIVKKHGYDYKLVYSLDQLIEILQTYKSTNNQAKTYNDGYIDGMLNAQITKV